MKFYKVVDGYSAFHDGELFKSKEDIIENLASYHSIDWDGQNAMGEYIEIEEYLANMSEEDQLDFLLEWGQWELEEIEGVLCPLCGEPIAHTQNDKSHFWKCKECAFIGMEYYDSQDIANLINETTK